MNTTLDAPSLRADTPSMANFLHFNDVGPRCRRGGEPPGTPSAARRVRPRRPIASWMFTRAWDMAFYLALLQMNARVGIEIYVVDNYPSGSHEGENPNSNHSGRSLQSATVASRAPFPIVPGSICGAAPGWEIGPKAMLGLGQKEEPYSVARPLEEAEGRKSRSHAFSPLALWSARRPRRILCLIKAQAHPRDENSFPLLS
jgi:hypothetical protein